MSVTPPKTVVIFDCESDGKPHFSFDGSRRENEFMHIQCTCACALVVAVKDLPSLSNATQVTCWRDVATCSGANPFEPLFQAFDAASVIVGFNALDFDFPLLWKHYGNPQSRYREHRIKCLDVFSRLRAVSGHWPKLDDLLTANGLLTKTGDGKEAIRMWQSCDRGGLEKYCQADVLRTAELALLPEMTILRTTIPEHVYGLLPMVRAVLG